MNIRPILASILPASWSGDAALAVVDFLEQLTDAVWLAHGQAMHDATTTQWRAFIAQPSPRNDAPNQTIDSDDLPF
jgi:hypothetical protein